MTDLTAVSRTQGNNLLVKEGVAVPRGYPLQFEVAPVLVDGFRRMVRELAGHMAGRGRTLSVRPSRIGRSRAPAAPPGAEDGSAVLLTLLTWCEGHGGSVFCGREEAYDLGTFSDSFAAASRAAATSPSARSSAGSRAVSRRRARAPCTVLRIFRPSIPTSILPTC